jgi:hypothetical protein
MAALDSNTKAVAGLVKKIRESDETQEWDLAGYTESQVATMVKGAFSDPVRLSAMSKCCVQCALRPEALARMQ